MTTASWHDALAETALGDDHPYGVDDVGERRWTAAQRAWSDGELISDEALDGLNALYDDVD
jgi:hypothetical protein